MRHHIEAVKPYTCPESAPDATLIKVYWHQVSADPRWLTGLKRTTDELYLPKRKSNRAGTSRAA